MDAIEKRARELLAVELEKDGNHSAAHAIRAGEATYGMKLLLASVRAIEAALTPPEGYVLAPVEPTKEMVLAACKDHGFPCGDRTVYARGYRSMLAARPEVKP